MLGRLTVCLLVTWTALTMASAFGQYGPPPGSGYAAQPTGWPVQQAGGWPHGYPGAATPEEYCPPEVDARIVNELLPSDRGFGWGRQSPLQTAIQDTAPGMWFRLEYMLTFIDNPGRGLLGAPLAGVDDPREPFLVQTPTGAVVTAKVLDVSSVDFDNINGLRGTIGIPFRHFSVEAVFWGTEQSTDVITPAPDQLPATNPLQDVQVIATSLLSGGAPGSLVNLYDESFQAPYSAQVFSAEANFYYNLRNPRLGWRFLPVLGFRHTDYDESLAQQGEFSNVSGIGPPPILIDPIVKRIDTWVDNNTYGVQTGFRSEFVHQHFTLGVEPKFTMGVNHYEATVRTSNLRDSPFPPIQDDGVVANSIARDVFSPIFDLQLYGKIHVTDAFHLRVGYSYTWLGNIARAQSSIYYNDLGLANPPAVVPKADDRDVWISTFTLGGEIILP